MEKPINVPLDEDAKAALMKRAKENGRAMNREAAMIIKAAVMADRANDGAARQILERIKEWTSS